MRTSIPAVVTRDGPDVTVEINGLSIKMICDTAKWECRFGVVESGTTIRVTFKPKEHLTTPKGSVFAQHAHK